MQSVVDDFRNDGMITPCEHTVQALEETSKLKPADVAEVSPDFLPAVSAAARGAQARRLRRGQGRTVRGRRRRRPPTAGPVDGRKPVHHRRAGRVRERPPTAGASPTATPTITAVPTATPVPTAAPARRPSPRRPATTRSPLGLWILLALLALTALLWLVALAVGRLGCGDERLAGSRHAWGEARYRAGGVWSDFTDWLRLRR